jgi:hypothetical protein
MKLSDYTSATVVENTDMMYLVQTSGTAKISKKVLISKLFEKINIKSIFQKGINYGTMPQGLSGLGAIDLTSGVVSLSCPFDSTFSMPTGTQGDEIIILVENNPSYQCVLTGSFATGNSVSMGLTGDTARFIFHYGKWYKV